MHALHWIVLSCGVWFAEAAMRYTYVTLNKTSCFFRVFPLNENKTTFIQWDGRALPDNCQIGFSVSNKDLYSFQVSSEIFRVNDCDFNVTYIYNQDIQKNFSCDYRPGTLNIDAVDHIYIQFNSPRTFFDSNVKLRVTAVFSPLYGIIATVAAVIFSLVGVCMCCCFCGIFARVSSRNDNCCTSDCCKCVGECLGEFYRCLGDFCRCCLECCGKFWSDCPERSAEVSSQCFTCTAAMCQGEPVVTEQPTRDETQETCLGDGSTSNYRSTSAIELEIEPTVLPSAPRLPGMNDGARLDPPNYEQPPPSYEECFGGEKELPPPPYPMKQ